MHQIAVGGALAQWQRLMLILMLLVAVWGPVQVMAFEHVVDGSAGSHDAVDATSHEREGLAEFPTPGREPGGPNDHRCGHLDVEREATQAISVRLAQPGVVTGLPITPPGEPRPALAESDGSRGPLRQALLVTVCVWRQ